MGHPAADQPRHDTVLVQPLKRQPILGIESLELDGLVVRAFQKIEPSIGEDAVDIHQHQPDLAGALVTVCCHTGQLFRIAGVPGNRRAQVDSAPELGPCS